MKSEFKCFFLGFLFFSIQVLPRLARLIWKVTWSGTWRFWILATAWAFSMWTTTCWMTCGIISSGMFAPDELDRWYWILLSARVICLAVTMMERLLTANGAANSRWMLFGRTSEPTGLTTAGWFWFGAAEAGLIRWCWFGVNVDGLTIGCGFWFGAVEAADEAGGLTIDCRFWLTVVGLRTGCTGADVADDWTIGCRFCSGAEVDDLNAYRWFWTGADEVVGLTIGSWFWLAVNVEVLRTYWLYWSWENAGSLTLGRRFWAVADEAGGLTADAKPGGRKTLVEVCEVFRVARVGWKASTMISAKTSAR